MPQMVDGAEGRRPVGGWRRANSLGLAVAVGIAYFLAAQLGLSLLTASERVAVFWPASGIAAGTLIALGPWARAPVALAVIGASAAAALMTERTVWSALAFGFCNAGEALLVTWLIKRKFGPAFNLDGLLRVLGFFAAAAVATAIAAVGASGTMKLFGPSTASFLDIWKVWFASDALGIISVAPLLIGVAAAVREAPPSREILEGALALVALAVVYGLALALLAGPRSLIAPATFVFPLLLWLGARCRPVFAGAAAFMVSAAVVWTTINEWGRFGDANQPIADRVLAAQCAILGATLAVLALAAVFAERRRHEVGARENEATLRSILDAANVIAWEVNLIRNTVQSAGPVARLLHRPQGGIPRDFAEMVETIHPEDRDGVMSQFWKAVGTAATFRLEFRLSSDALRWATAEGSVERDANGRALRVRGITHDITERKKAELALAEREAQLQLAGKAARVGSFAIDIATGRVQSSPGYAVIHGLAEGTEEFPRDGWRTRVHPDDLGRLDALRSQAFAEGRPEHNTEYRIVTPDGKTRWIESRALVSYDGDGCPTRMVGVNIDITERKRAQAALEESEVRYRALYDDNPSMYFTVDASGTVLSVNKFGARQLGYTSGELIGQSALQLIYEDDREAVRRHLAWCAENPETVAATELRKVHRDGTIMWVREVARALRESAGQQTVILIVCEEITARKRAEEQQNLLVAELDHRVKNVLASVAVVARRTSEHNSLTRDFIEALNRRIQSMADTHDLLSRSRWKPVGLADLVERELEPYASADNAIVEGPYVGLPPAAAQAVAMVLHELATNAAKYGALSTPQGRVSVRWLRTPNAGEPAKLRLEWYEDGGPTVAAPARPGYGTSVIRDLIPYELGGTVELDFSPSGVRCIIEIADESDTGQLAIHHTDSIGSSGDHVLGR